MEQLECFTAFIQLMGAVNFAYIVAHFPAKVHDLFFDTQKFEEDFNSFNNEISVDISSIEAMTPITTVEGTSTKNTIDKLKKEYNEFKINWENKRETILEGLEAAKKVKGFKCLFLNVSLFCVILLLGIGLLKATNANFWSRFNLFFVWGTTLSSSYLTFIVWKHKWDQRRDVNCYGEIGILFVIILLVSLGISVFCPAVNQESLLVRLSTLLGVFLSFYPCLLSVLFVLFHKVKIWKLKCVNMKSFHDKQRKLHEDKMYLDSLENVFTDPNWS